MTDDRPTFDATAIEKMRVMAMAQPQLMLSTLELQIIKGALEDGLDQRCVPYDEGRALIAKIDAALQK